MRHPVSRTELGHLHALMPYFRASPWHAPRRSWIARLLIGTVSAPIWRPPPMSWQLESGLGLNLAPLHRCRAMGWKTKWDLRKATACATHCDSHLGRAAQNELHCSSV